MKWTCFIVFFAEERAAVTKRSRLKDHQSSINSVDSNSNLEIFCSVRLIRALLFSAHVIEIETRKFILVMFDESCRELRI